MEHDTNTMREAFKMDLDHRSDASSYSGSLVSSGRLSNQCSFNRGSFSLSCETVGGAAIHHSLSRRGSKGRRSSSSLSRDVGDRILRSISLSRDLAEHILGDVDSSAIAQVGDIGDRVAIDDREGENGILQFPIDELKTVENGFQIGSYVVNSSTPVSPIAEDFTSPLPTDAILHSNGKDHVQNRQHQSFEDNQYKLPHRLDYASYLIHLALFGILGVLTRYLLQKLFGPSLLALTGDGTPLYLDLPSNMLGSFLMGWFGIVFKADIRHVSENLAIGLSTGYLGSLTTFSGWNQKMLDLASKGHWAFAMGGIVLGMFIVNESIRVGVESANGLRKSLCNFLNRNSSRTRCCLDAWTVNSLKRHLTVMTFMLLLLCSLWALSGALSGIKLDNATNGAVLWIGCLVGPPGVWARWYLARLNGQGFGGKGSLKWLPIGTLSANFLAASLMATLATISKAVDTKRCTIILSGVQFGFLGCLSTVSTFVAEVYAMRESGHSGRALAYILATIVPSFAIGTLIYSVPVWTKHYK